VRTFGVIGFDLERRVSRLHLPTRVRLSQSEVPAGAESSALPKIKGAVRISQPHKLSWSVAALTLPPTLSSCIESPVVAILHSRSNGPRRGAVAERSALARLR
jgi:hypothetical protein